MAFGPRVALLLAAIVVAGGCVSAPPPPAPTPPPPAMPPFTPDCSVSPGAGGAEWPEPCLALASPNDSPSKSEVDLAVNPKNPLNVVVASKDKDPLASDNCVWSVAQVTLDGGKTWKTVYVGGDRDNRVPQTAVYRCVTDPIMVFDDDGVFYYALQIYDHAPSATPQVPQAGTPGLGSAFILARSMDGGLTYDRYVLQAPGLGDLLFHDYPRMLVSPTTGSISTIWNAYTTPPVGPGRVAPVVVTSRDGGQTVDAPVSFTAPGAETDTQFFSGFGAAKDGTIYVTVAKNSLSDSGQPTDVWIWKSEDDARTFQEVGRAFTITPTPRQYGNHSFRTPSFVELAIDASEGNHSGRIHLFWPEFIQGQSDILTSHSDDGGVSWSAPVHVAQRTEGGQLFMRPTVGPDGTAFVLFATQAYSGSELLDQSLSWSGDGGTTWNEHRLTAVSYDGDKGIHQDGFPFIGDYNGLKVGPDGVVHAAFGYTGTGRAEVAYARVEPAALLENA